MVDEPLHTACGPGSASRKGITGNTDKLNLLDAPIRFLQAGH